MAWFPANGYQLTGSIHSSAASTRRFAHGLWDVYGSYHSEHVCCVYSDTVLCIILYVPARASRGTSNWERQYSTVGLNVEVVVYQIQSYGPPPDCRRWDRPAAQILPTTSKY
jgi:hypothetical protein